MNIPKARVMAMAVIVTAFFALPSNTAWGSTFTVTNTNDSGAGSLRQAILDANGSAGADTINFNAGVFPSGSPATIAISSSLPAVTGGGDTIDGSGAGVIIDGVSQGFNCIELNSADNIVKGIQLTDCLNAIDLFAAADNTTVGPDNVMYGNDTAVATRPGADGNRIIGNKIGTNAAGTAIAAGGNYDGVRINDSANNTIGGISLVDRNIISGNATGILLMGSLTTGTNIFGNFIGTDTTGTVDLGNNTGIRIQAAANTIGGTEPGQGNLISGNSVYNVQVFTSSSNNTISGNIIGPDVNGGGALVNTFGVVIENAATDNAVGPRNVLSDNAAGVLIRDAGTTGNTIKGNLIGTDLTGTAGLPNGDGVLIQLSAASNTIGGTGLGDGNVIAFNGAEGVEITGAATTGNSIRGNSIHSNVGAEIINTSGGNTELPPPILTATLFGTVSGFACASCVVDIFSDDSTDARFYQGSATAAGDGSFTFVSGALFIGSNVTATNTDASGNTSELATAIVIDSDGDGTNDGTDTDDDNDEILDVDDPCRIFPEDFDGFQDADGCPDPDNDEDGICDPGLASVSCTGSDAGEMVFDPAGTLSNPTIDCRNIAEDYDGFRDGDGCPEPDNDNDGFPDTTDDCPGTDAIAGADGMLGSPEDMNHNGVQDGAESPLTTDDSPLALSFEDYDGVIDTDGCHDSPGDDFDGDGWSDELEALDIGTNPTAACPLTSIPDDEEPDPWPPDFNDDQVVNIVDLNVLLPPPLGAWGATPGDPLYTVRKDVYPDEVINIVDLNPLLPAPLGSWGQTCTP